MTEMMKLVELLENSAVPHEITRGSNYIQVWYPNRINAVSDAIWDYGSYGYEEGLLEIMGLTENEGAVEGWLSAEEVFSRWRAHYENTKKHEKGGLIWGLKTSMFL